MQFQTWNYFLRTTYQQGELQLQWLKNNQNIMTFEKLSKVVKKSQRRKRNKKKEMLWKTCFPISAATVLFSAFFHNFCNLHKTAI